MAKTKHILVAVTGMTPQVVTETLYCFFVQRQPRVPISEVWLITTADGKRRAIELLLSNGAGQFFQFCQDHDVDLGQISFDEANIIVPADLTDIRDTQGNLQFADAITEFIRKKTSDRKTVLHCSIAGGRKTMSVFMAMALQLFGRKEDKLYHVLVSPPEFENHPDFFYIPRENRALQVKDQVSGEVREINTGDARVVLAEVPYIRLREKLDLIGERPRPSFSELVKTAQGELSRLPNLPRLTLNLEKKTALIGNKMVDFPPFIFAVYLFFAKCRGFQPGGKHFSNDNSRKLLALYSRLSTSFGHTERVMKTTFDNGAVRFEAVQKAVCEIRRRIRTLLANDPIAEYYIVSIEGKYGSKKYGIKLDKAKITIQKAE